MGAPAQSGFVIALCGDWGSGKTSVANMVVAELGDRAQVLPFNPWLYSGTDDLIARYFGQLTVLLGRGGDAGRHAAAKLSRYAGAVSSVAKVIPGLGTLSASADVAERMLGLIGQAQSLEDIRDDLTEALRELEHRILVVIDDVDRLADDEVHDIVRLVKLVADLPNLTYLLCFDRVRVEEILGRPSEGAKAAARGRAYLEKIVQTGHDLPQPRPAQLAKFLVEGLNEMLAGREHGIVHEHDFQNLLALGIRPLLRTPRDAARIINAMPAALKMHGDEVALVDLLGLETLRVLEPDVHRGLFAASDALLGGSYRLLEDDERRRERRREEIDALLEQAAGCHREAVRQVLAQLFPAAHVELGNCSRGRREFAIERRERRAAVPEVLRRYLHGSPDPGAVDTAVVQRLADLLNDPVAFAAELAGVRDVALPEVIERLDDFADRFDPAAVEGIAKAILALEPRLQDDARRVSTFGSPARWRWEALVQTLISVEPDEAQREAIVLRLVGEARTLTDRLRLLNWYGTHPDRSDRDSGSELLGVDATREANDDLRRRVRHADPEALAEEPEALLLVEGLLHPDPDSGQAILASKAESDIFMLALLTASVRHEVRHVVGDAVPHSWPVLNWDGLLRLLGEDTFRRRLEQLEARYGPDSNDLSPAHAEALELAMQVARGERLPGGTFEQAAARSCADKPGGAEARNGDPSTGA